MENEHIKFKAEQAIVGSLKGILKSEDLSKVEITVSIKFKEDDEIAKRKKVEEEEQLRLGKIQDADRRFETKWAMRLRSIRRDNASDQYETIPKSEWKNEKRKLREQFDAEEKNG